MMKSNIFMLVIGVLASWSVVSPVFSAEFSLPDTRSSVSVGDTFFIPVTLSPAGSLIDTARVVLSYDPTKLRAISFKLASVLDNSAPASFIDHPNGVISWGGFDVFERVSNTTMFGIASFKALSSGSAVVSLASGSHIISEGEEVGIPSDDRVEVIVSSTPNQPIVSKPDDSLALATPEYNYKIVHSSFLCRELPQICTQPWWVALISMILLITGILLLLVSHPHLTNRDQKDESD